MARWWTTSSGILAIESAAVYAARMEPGAGAVKRPLRNPGHRLDLSAID
jgi:hypothetical protein